MNEDNPNNGPINQTPINYIPSLPPYQPPQKKRMSMGLFLVIIVVLVIGIVMIGAAISSIGGDSGNDNDDDDDYIPYVPPTYDSGLTLHIYNEMDCSLSGELYVNGYYYGDFHCDDGFFNFNTYVLDDINNDKISVSFLVNGYYWSDEISVPGYWGGSAGDTLSLYFYNDGSVTYDDW